MDQRSQPNHSMIKQMNTSRILLIIRAKGPVSRAEISKITGLNPATVSSNMVDLIASGLVQETGIGKSSGGRKPTMLALNAEGFAVIALDMGTSYVHAAVVDLAGKVAAQTALPFPMIAEEASHDKDEVIAVMKQAVQEMLKSAGSKEVLGIGIGAHGLVDSKNGVSIYAPAFQWEDVPFARLFEQNFQLPVRIDNDVRAMALGEKWFGGATELSDFIFLNIGSGIGSGIYLNGDLIYGARFGAGEIGHIHVVDASEGQRCFCGKYGCLSTVASATALEKRFIKKLQEGESSLLHNSSAEAGSASMQSMRVTGKQIYEAAKQGDVLARSMLEETGEYIGHALSIAINIINPEKVIIGGGLSRAEQFLFPPMKRMIEERAMHNNTKHLIIERTALGDDSGIVGAAALVLRDVFMHPEQFIPIQKNEWS